MPDQHGNFQPSDIPTDVVLQDALAAYLGGFEQAEEAARVAYRALTVTYRRVVVDAEELARDENELRQLRAEHPMTTKDPTGTTVFHLNRDTDISGVSGTGIVADGVIWPDGTVSIRWRGDRPSVVHWQTLDDVKHIHGHGGATRIVLPVTERERLGRIADAHSKDVGPHGTTSGLCVECGQLWECPTYVWATTARDVLAPWDPADDDQPEEQP